MVCQVNLLGARRGAEQTRDAPVAFLVSFLGEGQVLGVRVTFTVVRCLKVFQRLGGLGGRLGLRCSSDSRHENHCSQK